MATNLQFKGDKLEQVGFIRHIDYFEKLLSEVGAITQKATVFIDDDEDNNKWLECTTQ